MLKNHITSAFRNLWKNRTYTILNIIGLTIGITCAAFIFLWVEDETTFNYNFVNRDHLYHIMQNEKSNRGISTSGSTPGPLSDAVKAEIPGIKNSGRLSWPMDELAIVGDKSIKINGIYADPSILSMYTLPFIQGNAKTAFQQVQSVIISESMAKEIFGETDPMGKTIKMNGNVGYAADGLYSVTGVFRDLPANCNYHFQWISPFKAWEIANPWVNRWDNPMPEVIVQLDPAASRDAVDNQLTHYLSKKVDGQENTLFLWSMNDWHLRANFENGMQTGGTIRYVHLFTLIAIAILLIACINFMNLATARSEQRTKEVGVLKVLGAGRGRLIGKFISEAVALSFLAVLLSIGLLYLLLPAYNTLVDKQLSIHLFQFLHWSSLLAVAIVAGIVAGSYPAFYLSSFNPIFVLKGLRIKSGGSVVFIRKGLVIAQFTASVILIICTVIIYQQVQHIKNRNIGYTMDKLVYLDLQGNMKKNFEVLKNRLIATGYVENAATALHDALHIYSAGNDMTWQGKDLNMKLPIHYNAVSPDYISTMHLQFLSGRDFYPTFGMDSQSVIINESMAKLMGKEGKTGSILSNGSYHAQVIGIIRDFVYNDIYGPGTPLILFPDLRGATVMALRFKPTADLSKALAATESVVTTENPGYPFEYHFADEAFDALFAVETLIGKLAGVFATLAVFISCLGLFGLAAYTAERRAKEMGIRKVLGASTRGLAGLLSKEFLQLVIISCLIAFPVAWWAMKGWLQGYEYRTTIHWWVFAVAGVLALVVALLTVSFKAIQTAWANPIKALRSE
ncbi:ABC transporter permease [Dinghuibacter silviterrae]|uniref:ABC-type antimicrobial peptide transport system permease subunit n=1 Tax=Dinghuibacter silviterrae TaxID=1539049 RepID=A0A4R8DFH7_9BACT|nr:ABC transporter permease [Dinghuibacter silviterrae]TDW96349.1 ABC-type antimicrobial peptide transport system permease subunit [Dinghuibacter silviterrae]